MEIYRLKDEVPEGKRKKSGTIREGVDLESGGVCNGELKVTDLKQGVRNLERVNVYVNGEFACSLDVTQVVDLGVKVGVELSAEKLAELKKASEFGKLYQRALEWVLMRPRSEKEVRDYLWRKLHGVSSGTASRRPVFKDDARRSSQRQLPKDSLETPSELSQEIVERLVSKKYIDDRRFAEFWVENRFVKKGVSQKRLRMELVKKGVAKEIIDEVLGGRDDREEIKKMIAKKRAKYDTPEKLMAYLCRQGFAYDLVKELVEEG